MALFNIPHGTTDDGLQVCVHVQDPSPLLAGHGRELAASGMGLYHRDPLHLNTPCTTDFRLKQLCLVRTQQTAHTLPYIFTMFRRKPLSLGETVGKLRRLPPVPPPVPPLVPRPRLSPPPDLTLSAASNAYSSSIRSVSRTRRFLTPVVSTSGGIALKCSVCARKQTKGG